MTEISFGADPEFMLMKDERYYSAIDIIKGDIADRIKIDGHEFYWDNVLAECAIKPSSSKEETVENFRKCFELYASLAHPYKLVPQASQYYPDAELLNEKSRKAGCAPDTCAYTIRCKKPPKGIIEKTNLRTGGGHVHIGANIFLADNWEHIIGVRLLDLFIGIPSMFMDHDPTSQRRRKVYGQAGRFRSKPYGLEYRSLGNFWLASPKLVELIYDLAVFVVDFMEEKRYEGIYSFNEELYYSLPISQLKKAYICLGFDEPYLIKALNKNHYVKDEFLTYSMSFMTNSLRKRIIEAIQPRQYNFYEEWGINVKN